MNTLSWIRRGGIALALAVSLRAYGYYEIPDSDLENWKAGKNIVTIQDGRVLPSHLKPGALLFVTGFDSTNGACYYVYLPTRYNVQLPPPVIMGFDPSANGRGPVMKIMPSAEERGWMVMGYHLIGNNTPPEQAEPMTRACLQHFRRFFPHQRAREYGAGLSGGACYAYDLARVRWGEIAGVLNYEGWLHDYDRYILFPRGLAVAFLPAQDRTASLLWSQRDVEYLERSAAHTQFFPFSGNQHVWAPPEATDRALAWLDGEYSQYGTPREDPVVLEASRLMLQSAEKAFSDGDDSRAALSAMTVVAQYAHTPAVDQALDVLSRIYSDGQRRGRVAWPADMTERPLWSLIAHERSMGLYHPSPNAQQRAFLELALQLNATNFEANADLASHLARVPTLTREEWIRAQALVERALGIETNHWMGWSAGTEIALRQGDFQRALARAETGLETTRAIIDPCGHRRDQFMKFAESARVESAKTQAVPLVQHFEIPDTAASAASLPGWYVSCGTAVVQEDSPLTGRRALMLANSNAMVRVNFAPLPGAREIWLDYYATPAVNAQVLPLANPASPAAWSLAPDGRLRGLDGDRWVTSKTGMLDDSPWHRWSICYNIPGQTYSIYVDDHPVLVDLRFAAPVGSLDFIEINGAGDAGMFVDSLRISTEEPLRDTDVDTLPDDWETQYGLDRDDPREANGANGDPDGDGLPNYREFEAGSSPVDYDTDHDRMADGAELSLGANPGKPYNYESIALPSSIYAGQFNRQAWTCTPGAHPRVKGRVLSLEPSLATSAITRHYAAGPKTVIWLELNLKPTPGPIPDMTDRMRQGAALLFLNSEGLLTAYDGRTTKWVTLQHVPVEAGSWIKVRVRLDYRTKTWSIWYDGSWRAESLGFANPDKTEYSTITIQGTGEIEHIAASPHGYSDDGDTIPDEWELRYFKNLTDVNGHSDADRDGFPDASEYLAGTDPLDPEDLLRIRDVKIKGTMLVITWDSKPFNYEGNPISYRLLQSSGLMEGLMPAVATDIRASYVVCTYEIPTRVEEAARFYKIQVEP